MTSQFPGQESRHDLAGPLAQGPCRLQSGGCGHLKVQLGVDLPPRSLQQLLAGLGSLQVVALRVSVSCGLLTVAMWASPRNSSLCGSWLDSEPASERAGDGRQADRSHSLWGT